MRGYPANPVSESLAPLIQAATRRDGITQFGDAIAWCSLDSIPMPPVSGGSIR
ncbi:MAG: hypothetical protein P1V13_24690 [Rhizobiaceae bacterium]|nr:hypothetical protein [Rhizobiaceae bacterium]